MRRVIGLPPPENRYYVVRDVHIPMRDGVRLIAERYVPVVPSPAHTVLIRSPYGRGYPYPQFYAQPLAARGFHVVVQSVRGTYGSGGTFEPAVNEAADGVDTVAWMRDQPWFTGKVATIGPSYLGLVQWALLQDPPPELAAAVILAAPHDLSASWATGSFTLDDNARFTEGIGRLDKQKELSEFIRHRLTGVRDISEAITLPVSDSTRDAIGRYAPLYESWLSHPNRDESFWKSARFDSALERSEVPVLLVNGWQDAFVNQTFEQYRLLRDRDVDVALTIGPWVHDRMLRQGASTFVAESIDWLKAHLNDTTDVKPRSAVKVFIRGHEWVDLPEWPPAMPDHVLHPQPQGGLGAPVAEAPPSSFTFDPADPTPTVGGPLLGGGGYREDTSLAERPDVLSFTSEPLTEDLFVVGSPVCELMHSADNPNVDVFVRISEVDADGHSANVTEGLRRVTLPQPEQPARLDVTLDAVAHRFAAGSRIRLLVAGGSHPRFARHHGTAEPTATADQLIPATHFVHHGGWSRLVLPAADRPPT